MKNQPGHSRRGYSTGGGAVVDGGWGGVGLVACGGFGPTRGSYQPETGGFGKDQMTRHAEWPQFLGSDWIENGLGAVPAQHMDAGGTPALLE